MDKLELQKKLEQLEKEKKELEEKLKQVEQDEQTKKEEESKIKLKEIKEKETPRILKICESDQKNFNEKYKSAEGHVLEVEKYFIENLKKAMNKDIDIKDRIKAQMNVILAEKYMLTLTEDLHRYFHSPVSEGLDDVFAELSYEYGKLIGLSDEDIINKGRYEKWPDLTIEYDIIRNGKTVNEAFDEYYLKYNNETPFSDAYRNESGEIVFPNIEYTYIVRKNGNSEESYFYDFEWDIVKENNIETYEKVSEEQYKIRENNMFKDFLMDYYNAIGFDINNKEDRGFNNFETKYEDMYARTKKEADLISELLYVAKNTVKENENTDDINFTKEDLDNLYKLQWGENNLIKDIDKEKIVNKRNYNENEPATKSALGEKIKDMTRQPGECYNIDLIEEIITELGFKDYMIRDTISSELENIKLSYEDWFKTGPAKAIEETKKLNEFIETTLKEINKDLKELFKSNEYWNESYDTIDELDLKEIKDDYEELEDENKNVELYNKIMKQCELLDYIKTSHEDGKIDLNYDPQEQYEYIEESEYYGNLHLEDEIYEKRTSEDLTGKKIKLLPQEIEEIKSTRAYQELSENAKENINKFLGIPSSSIIINNIEPEDEMDEMLNAEMDEIDFFDKLAKKNIK